MNHLNPEEARKLTSREVAMVIESFAGSLIPQCIDGSKTMIQVYDYLGDPDYRERRIEIWRKIEIGFQLVP